VLRSGDGVAGGSSRRTGSSQYSASTTDAAESSSTASVGPGSGAGDRCSSCGGAVGTATRSQHPGAPGFSSLAAGGTPSLSQQHDADTRTDEPHRISMRPWAAPDTRTTGARSAAISRGDPNTRMGSDDAKVVPRRQLSSSQRDAMNCLRR